MTMTSQRTANTPVILTVDDEPQVLNAIERDLRRHFRNEYRVIKAGSGQEGLDVALNLKQRNTPLALFLVDQRMPLMSGTEFLAKARAIYPDARKVLLTAYADTEAAISSINTIGLDYYLMKPWDPPEQKLYPVLDDLLSDWQRTADVPFDGIRVAGTLWSSASHTVKDFLARNRVPYKWLDVERDGEAKLLVESVQKEKPGLPVIFFPDGSNLVAPTTVALAEKVGLQIRATQPFYDLIILGAGPAGLGAAVYAVSEGLRTALIEKEATGGQAGTSSRLENYLGFPNGISGGDLAQRATIQARRFGAEILTAVEVSKVRTQDSVKVVSLTDGTELTCRAVIIATGVSIKALDTPGVKKLTGAGVYYGAAVTEAAHYRGQHVMVVGGANSAGQGAMFFARYANKVTMLVRANNLEKGTSSYLIEQIKATPNIAVQLNSEVVSVQGEDRLESVTFKNAVTGEARTWQIPAIFLFIGAVPHTEAVAGLVERNSFGFILTGQDLMLGGQRPKGWTLPRDPYPLETSVPGIFAAGDVRQAAVRRVASAVGEGAIAVSLVHQYLASV